jgi:hypothetical protein
MAAKWQETSNGDGALRPGQTKWMGKYSVKKEGGGGGRAKLCRVWETSGPKGNIYPRNMQNLIPRRVLTQYFCTLQPNYDTHQPLLSKKITPVFNGNICCSWVVRSSGFEWRPTGPLSRWRLRLMLSIPLSKCWWCPLRLSTTVTSSIYNGIHNCHIIQRCITHSDKKRC